MSDVVWIHSKEDLENAIALGGKVVIRFTAEAWCVPCQRFAPHYERAAGEVEDVKFLSVDLDTNPWVMEDYGVRSVPTVYLYDDGEYVRTVVAPQSAINFIKDLRS